MAIETTKLDQYHEAAEKVLRQLLPQYQSRKNGK